MVLAIGQSADASRPHDRAKPPSLRGYTVMVAGSKCPRGSSLVGFAGAYGAEDVGAAAYDRFLYRVTTDAWTDETVLRRDKAPLVMSACLIH
jgi:hypothetical protein